MSSGKGRLLSGRQSACWLIDKESVKLGLYSYLYLYIERRIEEGWEVYLLLF